MPTSRRSLLAGTASLTAAAAWSPTVHAQGSVKPGIRVGVLTDMSGPYSDNSGRGSVAATRLAVEDFRRTDPGFEVDVVSADFQSSSDIGTSVARQWLDQGGVDLIIGVPSSPLSLGLANLVRERDKVAIITGAGTTELTGRSCGPNHVHWVFDTWSSGSAICQAFFDRGGKSWYFVAADYTYGHTLVNDAAATVKRLGGTVLGEIFAPFPGTIDFSSYLLQAQASRADVIAFANAGSDMVNCLKQAVEFGLRRPPTHLAGLGLQLSDVRAAGLEITQGMALAEPFYWNLNDGTRTFARRFATLADGRMPGMLHAGDYSGTLHYLRAAKALGLEAAKTSGRAVVAQMKRMPTDDPLFGQGSVRADGRVLHNMYLFQVKSPAQSSSSWDCYDLLQTVPGDRAFRPMADGNCPMVHT